VARPSVYSSVEQQIVGLDVSMNESKTMNRLDRLRRFSNIELREIFAEDLLLDEQRHEIA
jgi:hypothetical protein